MAHLYDNQHVTDKLFAAIVRKKFKLAKILIEGGVEPNVSLSSGITPLMAACDSVVNEDLATRKKSLIKCLLSYGADLNVVDRHGRTALHYAYICGDSEISLYLQQKGADSSIRDINGQIAESYMQMDNSFGFLSSPVRTRRDSVASMVNVPTRFRTWDSREFLDSILED